MLSVNFKGTAPPPKKKIKKEKKSKHIYNVEIVRGIHTVKVIQVRDSDNERITEFGLT